MTFDRFYSIIMPHKAASFNTVKRAKITIVSIILLAFLYNVPHLFVSSVDGKQCLPYGAALNKSYGQFYYWLSFTLSYAFPFVLLLTMNSIIIHILRTRSILQAKQEVGSGRQGQGQDQGQTSKSKNSERQIFAILFLVTFGFLILTTPANLLFLFIMVVDFTTSPQLFAGYYLFYNIANITPIMASTSSFMFYLDRSLEVILLNCYVGKRNLAHYFHFLPPQKQPNLHNSYCLFCSTYLKIPFYIFWRT